MGFFKVQGIQTGSSVPSEVSTLIRRFLWYTLNPCKFTWSLASFTKPIVTTAIICIHHQFTINTSLTHLIDTLNPKHRAMYSYAQHPNCKAGIGPGQLLPIVGFSSWSTQGDSLLLLFLKFSASWEEESIFIRTSLSLETCATPPCGLYVSSCGYIRSSTRL